jgi:hypothetical protein
MADGANKKAALVEAAKKAARGMLASTEGKDGAAAVNTDVRTFRSLAAMLNTLSGEVAQCGGSDCMGRKIDGLRLWVTHDQLTVAQAEAETLRHEIYRLRAALRRIAEEDAEPMGLVALFDDASSVRHHFRGLAATALETH